MHQNRDLTNDKYGQMAENWFTIPQNSLTLRVANSWRELELEVSNVLPVRSSYDWVIMVSYYVEFLFLIVVRMYLIFSNHGLDELDLTCRNGDFIPVNDDFVSKYDGLSNKSGDWNSWMLWFFMGQKKRFCFNVPKCEFLT